MRANRATTAAMPSPTFTNATTCTLPKSSPLLSSSFTPFYPRSQQQVFHPDSGYVGPYEDGFQASAQHSDDRVTDQSHFSSWPVRGSKFYDSQYYAALGADPYDISWVPTGGTVWDGRAWQQWGDPAEYAYAEDDTGDSANLFSDSLSYYTESPTLEQDISACASSNIASLPTLLPIKDHLFSRSEAYLDNSTSASNIASLPMALPNKDGHFSRSEAYLNTSSSITGGTAMPNVVHNTIMQKQASCASKKSKESSRSSFRELKGKAGSGFGQGPPKDDIKVAAIEFTGCKFDLNSSSSQVAVQMSPDCGSQAGELKATTELGKNVQAQKEGNVLLKASYNLSKERESADAIDRNHLVSITSHTIEPINHPDIKSSTVSLATEINQNEIQSMRSVSHHHASMQPSNELCQSMAFPKAVNSQDLEEVNGLDGMCQEKPKSSIMPPEDVGFLSNEPHLLVECIHNLSKVLLSTKSKTSINALSSPDCLVLESTICMLSHRLFQCSAIEANSCEDSSCQQDPKDSIDSMKVFVEPASLQKASSRFASMKHILSFKRDCQREVLQNAPKVTAARSMGEECQSSNLMNDLQVSKEELRVLRGELQNLQAELGYERAESNAVVSIYKDLWSEAQEALQVYRSEMKEIRTELAGLKQELTNLKLSGGVQRECEIAIDDTRISFKQENSNIVTSSSHGVLVSDSSRASIEKGNNTCRGSSSKSTLNHTIAPPMNLENDVAQRLSLLLSRQGLDLNKTCAESCMEWPSELRTSLEPLPNVPGEDEAMPPNDDYLVWSETSYLVNGENGSGCSISNLSGRRRHGCQEEEDCLYGLTERGSNDGDMDAAVLKEGSFQEDEIEIICFKPGIGDSNSTCLKGEPEWEDVVVNALDDNRLTREEMV